MAPKKRAVGKQAPKAAASSPSSAASKRCQEDRRNAEESVKRGLADHCASLSAYVIYDLLNEEGHSLYTKALAKKESLTKRQRISSQWWRETINEFVNLAGSMAGMTVTNPAEVVDAQLDKALDLLDSSNTTRRSSSALRSWMSTCTAMNQRSLVGLIRAVSSLNSSSKNAAEVIMDMGELLHRLDIKARHPVEFQHAKSIVDQALVTMYACERRDSDNAKFVEDNKAAIEVAADIAIFRGLSAAGVDFAARREDISQAIQGSKIGRKMFGGLWMHVATEFVANTIEAKFEGLAENATVDVAFLTAVKAEVLVVAETMCFEDVLNCRRNVTVAYRAVKLKMLVTSLLEEIDLRSRAAVKSLAVGRLLTAMHWEADFGEALVPGGACAVSADLLRKADEARADFNSCLDDGDGQSMDKVMELMRDKRDRFLKKDRFWGIEAEFASVCAGDHGIDVISKRVLQCFPDQQVTKAMPGTMDELKALERTPLYKYSSRSGQGRVSTAQMFLRTMMSGQAPPHAKGKESDHAAELRQRLPHFCKFEVEEAGEKKMLSGTAALKASFEAMQEEEEEADLPKLDIFNSLRAFLPPDLHQALDAKNQAALKDASAVARLTAAAAAAAQDVQGSSSSSSSRGSGAKPPPVKKAKKSSWFD